MTATHTTFSEVSPASLTTPMPVPMEDLIERLRAVRRKVSRWLPSSEMLAFLSVDYAEIYKAASRLEAAVQELDGFMRDEETFVGPRSLQLQLLLCKVEERANEFEESVVENLGH